MGEQRTPALVLPVPLLRPTKSMKKELLTEENILGFSEDGERELGILYTFLFCYNGRKNKEKKLISKPGRFVSTVGGSNDRFTAVVARFRGRFPSRGSSLDLWATIFTFYGARLRMVAA